MTASRGAPDERRQYPRRADARWAFCYQDGTRFDACTLDVSAGGALVATDATLPIGATVIAVVEHPSQPKHPVQLVGRVVRRQTEPVAGYGIEFLGVGSTARDADALRSFVADYLGLGPNRELMLERRGLRLVGWLKSTEAVAPSPTAQAPEPPPAASGSPGGGGASPASPEGVAPRPRPGPADYARRARVAGPITEMFLQPDALAPARVVASMVVGRTSCRVTLLGVGRMRALILTDVVPARRNARVLVRFPLPDVGQPVVPIAIIGEMTDLVPVPGEEEPGLLLAVSGIEEPGDRGLFDSWLRKLACRGFIDLPE